MAASTPIESQVIAALYAVLASGVNTHLAELGADLLDAAAFLPVRPSMVAGDTVAVFYAGSDHSADRITVQTRDLHLDLDLYLVGCGSDHAAAQDRVIAIQYAVRSTLEDPANRYLGGLLQTPLTLGRSAPAADDDEQTMYWQLLLPVGCAVRITRPEQVLS